ncbi:hypothetical protein P5706_15585 [Pseudomonas sp. ChxA]|uniref:phage tail assembly chaperone n=1 Tax=Bacteria TaxID=2 RepID=UPI002557436D|nr:hypothetical protein [Pseudomonas sp. ChxA]MDL2185606.1 hypothetical protein [Pseudomonas sp. ChxA]
MAIETKKITISGQAYEFKQYSAAKGFPVMNKMLRLIGPTLEAHTQRDTKLVATTLLDQLFDPEVEELFKELVATATVDGEPVDFDTEFSGAYDHLFKFVMYAIQFQFGDALFKPRYTRTEVSTQVQTNEDGSQQAGNPRLMKVEKNFSQDFNLYLICTSTPQLATLHELQTIYNVGDAFDLIEFIQAHITFQEEANKAAQT